MNWKFFILLPLILTFIQAGAKESENKQQQNQLNKMTKGNDIKSEDYRKLWNPKVQAKIDSNIEKYRKGNVIIEVIDQNGRLATGAIVNIEQQTHDFLFGCNLFVLGQLDTPELNKKYESAFIDLFNFATIPFYWGDLEPEEGKPRFSEGSSFIWRRPPPDRLVKWCKTNNITAKGHALMYNRNTLMPEWTVKDNPETFMKQAEKHIAEIAENYKNDIKVWDVVNEERYRTLKPETGHMVPDDYLPQCFRIAANLFPEDIVLLYNDDTQNHENPFRYAEFINDIKGKGIRIDGMGLQFHLFSLNDRNKYLEGNLYPLEQLIKFYDHMIEFGLPIYITEITVPGIGENGSKIQAMIVKDLYRLWFSIPGMAGITWWNLGDGTAHGRENTSCAGLLDKDMNPKPAYHILDELINNDWKTNEVLQTNNYGKVQLRGFYGKYKISVSYHGKDVKSEVTLNKSGNNHYTIQL